MLELGFGPNDIQSLQRVEWSKLTAASNAAAAKISPGTNAADWVATVDGRVLAARSFAETASDLSKNVPLMVGSVSEEGMRYASNPTEAEWRATLVAQFGEAKATALIAAMKKAHPHKSIRLLSYGVTGIALRNSVQRIVNLKHQQRGAPVFAYYFTWQSPMLEDAGRLAHRRARLLLRQHQALRTGHRQHTRSAGPRPENGHRMGQLCPHRQPQPTRPPLGACRSCPLPDHGLRQRIPHGR
jgi:carboxylesterase type B